MRLCDIMGYSAEGSDGSNLGGVREWGELVPSHELADLDARN